MHNAFSRRNPRLLMHELHQEATDRLPLTAVSGISGMVVAMAGAVAGAGAFYSS